MNLLVLIILGTILGYLLILMGPFFGALIAFGIVVGCLFRGLILLNEINNKLSKSSRKTDNVYALLKFSKEAKKDTDIDTQIDTKDNGSMTYEK
nr:hypothetical protein [Falsibacillus pallidus]